MVAFVNSCAKYAGLLHSRDPLSGGFCEGSRVNRYCLLSALIAAVAMAACATVETQQQQTSENKPDKSYITGSRIPIHDSTGSASVKTIDNKQGVDDAMQNRAPMTNPSSGGGR